MVHKKNDSEIFETFRQWRENNERKSFDALVLLNQLPFWKYIHKNKDIKKLGSESYILTEQAVIAYLDVHSEIEALYGIKYLSDEFPGSLRVMRLNAAALEATENYDGALEILDRIIKVDETNAPARKRRVTIFKAQGLITEAIKELVDYLKKFMSDMEAWQELSELYMQVQEYSKAAFCVEELILHQPHNHLMHQRLADIRYTMGGVENMELAKSYYSQALKLNPQNMRALLGLFLVTNNLLNQYKSSGSSKRKEIWKLSQWVQSKLSAYQAKAQSKSNSTALTTMMLALAITE